MPTVVVLPVPLTPTISVTCGRWPFESGASTLSNTRRISSLTRSRRLSPRRLLALTASTIRSVAAMPTSADTSSSSSASIVSTSTGLVRCSGDVRLLDDLIKAADDLLLRPAQAFTKPIKKSQIPTPNPNSQTPARLSCVLAELALTRFRALRAQHQILERRARVLAPGQQLLDLRRDRQLDADVARPVPARPRWSARPQPPSSFPPARRARRGHARARCRHGGCG